MSTEHFRQQQVRDDPHRNQLETQQKHIRKPIGCLYHLEYQTQLPHRKQTTVEIKTDGAYKPGTGKAGIGFVISTNTNRCLLEGHGQAYEATTNMEAEACAVLVGVKEAIKIYDPEHLIIVTDCIPLKEQLIEIHLGNKQIYRTIKETYKDIKDVSIRTVDNNFVHRADTLADKDI